MKNKTIIKGKRVLQGLFGQRPGVTVTPPAPEKVININIQFQLVLIN
jgi:hypothetical protein